MGRFSVGVLMVVLGMMASVTVSGADLTAKNRKVYRDYRVESVGLEQLTVSYTADEGHRAFIGLPYALLPDEVRKRYEPEAPLKSETITAATAAIPAVPERYKGEEFIRRNSEILKNQLAAIPAKDVAARNKILERTRVAIDAILDQWVQRGQFRVLAADADGVILRVDLPAAGSRLKSGMLLYLYGSEAKPGRDLRLEIYPTAERMSYDIHGLIPVFAVSEELALGMVLNTLAQAVGVPELFVAPAGAEAAPAAATAADTTGTLNTIYVESPPNWYWGNNWYWGGYRPRPPRPWPPRPCPPVPPRPPRPPVPPRPQPRPTPNTHVTTWPLPDSLRSGGGR